MELVRKTRVSNPTLHFFCPVFCSPSKYYLWYWSLSSKLKFHQKCCHLESEGSRPRVEVAEKIAAANEKWKPEP